MKRCPQCLFIYPESDTRCDFDNTPLVAVDEAELDAATNSTPTPAKPRQSKLLLIAGIAGLLLGVIAFVGYYSFAQRTQKTAEIQSNTTATPEPVVAPQPAVASPSPEVIASPSPSPSPTPKSSAERLATSHSSTTVSPVSTSGPGMGKKLGGKPVILLTSGGKIDADEVWRTRDGVWYRRAGIVTLLKHGRVKAILNQ
jgi:hypothetical protein